MGNIYALDSNRNLLLYTSGSDICLRTAIGHSLTRPVTLSQDYSSTLSDVIYRDTIFYAYQNTNADILVKNITDPSALYQKSSQATPDCFQPQLAVLGQALLLFYFVKNPLDDTYVTKCQLPLETQQTISFESYTFTNIPSLHCVPLSNQLLLFFTDTKLRHALLLDENYNITTFPTPDHLSKLSALHTQNLEKTRISHEKELAQLLSQHQTELSQTIASFQESIQKRDLLIESIKAQYTELMNTATRYREEAIKWRKKYIDANSF